MVRYEGKRYGAGELPNHLGGHAFVTHTDEGALKYLKDRIGVSSMIDVGCGPGAMVDLATEKFKIEACGIDGDILVERKSPCLIHDFQEGPPKGVDSWYFDLAWCVEFVEHVEQKYEENFAEVFRSCMYVAMTGAPPGKGGHHHVNCQDQFYWIGRMDDWGFDLSIELTRGLRDNSTMVREFVRENGLVFVNRGFGSI